MPQYAQDADFPRLVPLGPLVAAAPDRSTQNANIESDLRGRVASLRARAARLRGDIIGPATRARMRRGVTTR